MNLRVISQVVANIGTERSDIGQVALIYQCVIPACTGATDHFLQ